MARLDLLRGPAKVCYPADLIAVSGNPLDEIKAPRDVRFVLRNGQAFKRDGVVLVADFLRGGPVYRGRH